jgi:hypothetical protein
MPIPRLPNALPQADVSQFSTKEVLFIKLLLSFSCASPVALTTPSASLIVALMVITPFSKAITSLSSE